MSVLVSFGVVSFGIFPFVMPFIIPHTSHCVPFLFSLHFFIKRIGPNAYVTVMHRRIFRFLFLRSILLEGRSNFAVSLWATLYKRTALGFCTDKRSMYDQLNI